MSGITEPLKSDEAINGQVTTEGGAAPRRREVLADGVECWLGDCRTLLHLVPMVDACVTDPPYGIGFAAQPTKWQRRAGKVAESWDDLAFESLSEVIACGEKQVVWGGNYYELPPSRGWLSWFKPDAPPSMASVEFAWTNLNQNARQITCSIGATNAERVGHPTQKPLAVMLFTLEQIGEARQVCDPFMGSGTTGVAAVRLGKKFIGIEREEKYFNMAVKRIADELSRPSMFIERPKPAKQEVML